MDMPVPVQTKRFVQSYYRQKLKEVPYSNAFVHGCDGFAAQFYNHSDSQKQTDAINIYCGHPNCGSPDMLSISGQDVDLLQLGQSCLRYGDVIDSSGVHLDITRRDDSDPKIDPYSPLCMVPLPSHFIETNFIRRRNERERERVRCVNEGYDRLKEHLPIANKDRRISKVETLRRAIDYIRELQMLLDETSLATLAAPCPDDTTLLKQRRH